MHPRRYLMGSRTLGVTLVALALALCASTAEADLLVLSYSGSFGPTSTLGGTAFGVPTAFTFEATFDSTTDTNSSDGIGIFDGVVTFHITGFGTFTTTYTPVLLEDPNFPFLGTFGAGLGEFSGGGFLGAFRTATPPFDADAPGPSVLSSFLTPVSSLPFTIARSGSAGDLIINDLASLGTTATIRAAVPEPSTLTLLGLGTVSLAGYCWRRRQQAPQPL